jgi:hypothetical protein
MKQFTISLFAILLPMALGSPTDKPVAGNSPPLSSYSQSKPLLAAASLPWHGSPRLVYDDSFRDQGMVGSYNWSGYAATNETGTVTYVAGTWTVPTVSASENNQAQYSAIWVGIDGFDSGTVEQLGTMQAVENVETESRGGKVSIETEYLYEAWVEMYPAGMVVLSSTTPGMSGSGTVNPGDTITASVTWNGGTSYSLSMTDAKEGWTYGPVAWKGSKSAEQNSAEWIVEAPSSNSGILPLADFGTEVFSACNATITGQNGNAEGTIGDFLPTLEDTIMVSERGDQDMAVPAPSNTAITSAATGFNDTWHSSGP